MMKHMQNARVTIWFYGRISGALGVGYDIMERRTIQLPDEFTEAQAKEAARVNLYEKQGDSPAYERVTVDRIAFN